MQVGIDQHQIVKLAIVSIRGTIRASRASRAFRVDRAAEVVRIVMVLLAGIVEMVRFVSVFRLEVLHSGIVNGFEGGKVLLALSEDAGDERKRAMRG